MLAARVAPVPECILLDTDEALSEAALDAAWAYGARGLIRYVGFAEAPFAGDLTLAERDRILARGFGLMVVQHVRRPLWTPSSERGLADGENAARHALAAGYLPGSTLWDDLEGIAPGERQATVSYANDKRRAVLAAGFEQGEYIGDRVPLTGAELYHWLTATLYWKSGSAVPDVAERGYAMVQEFPGIVLAGTAFDVNHAAPDRLGGVAHWTVADAPENA